MWILTTLTVVVVVDDSLYGGPGSDDVLDSVVDVVVGDGEVNLLGTSDGNVIPKFGWGVSDSVCFMSVVETGLGEDEVFSFSILYSVVELVVVSSFLPKYIGFQALPQHIHLKLSQN